MLDVALPHPHQLALLTGQQPRADDGEGLVDAGQDGQLGPLPLGHEVGDPVRIQNTVGDAGVRHRVRDPPKRWLTEPRVQGIPAKDHGRYMVIQLHEHVGGIGRRYDGTLHGHPQRTSDSHYLQVAKGQRARTGPAPRPQATAGNLNPQRPPEVTVNHARPFRPIRPLAGVLAALTATLSAGAAAAPAALALPVPRGAAATGPCNHPRRRSSSAAECPAGRSPSSPWPPRPWPRRRGTPGPGRPPTRPRAAAKCPISAVNAAVIGAISPEEANRLPRCPTKTRRSPRRAAAAAGTSSGTSGRSPRSRTAHDQPAHQRQNEVAS